MGNLSPLHWENSHTILINDSELINTIQDFIQPMYDVIPAIYLGIDVAIDDKGKFYIIEINKAPGLEMFVRDNGLEPIVEMQKYIINDQQNEQQRNQNSNTK